MLVAVAKLFHFERNTHGNKTTQSEQKVTTRLTVTENSEVPQKRATGRDICFSLPGGVCSQF